MIVLLSIFIFCLDVFLALYIDATGSWLTHPTRKNFFTREILPGKRMELRIDNVTMHFTKSKGYKCEKEVIARALNDVDLVINKPNNLIGLVAQNGGGKTTLFKLILGMYRPTKGRIMINGLDPQKQQGYFRAISVVFQENIIIEDFSVLEQMRFIQNVMGEPDSDHLAHLESMGIGGTMVQKVQTLSGGQQRRLQIAMTMMRRAPVLRIFDEPACGVDIESRKFLWGYLKDKADCMTILTTHIMEEAEMLCDEVLILKKGSVVAFGSMLFIKQSISNGYELLLESPEEFGAVQADQSLVQFQKLERRGEGGGSVIVPFQDQECIPGILGRYDCQVLCPSLTEVFLKICDEEGEAEPLIENRVTVTQDDMVQQELIFSDAARAQ